MRYREALPKALYLQKIAVSRHLLTKIWSRSISRKLSYFHIVPEQDLKRSVRRTRDVIFSIIERQKNSSTIEGTFLQRIMETDGLSI